MNIYIYQNNKQDFKYLKDVCIKFLIQSNIEAEIISCSENPENLSENISVFLLEYDETIKNTAKIIYSANNFNYIIITANNFLSINCDIFPFVRPSGFIIRPFSYAHAEIMLKGVFDNLKEISNNNAGIFNFKIHSQEFHLPFSSILYFESCNKKIKVRTISQEFEIYLSLEKIESIMPDDFTRIHKGFIVNMNRICSIDYKNMLVNLEDGYAVPVSRNFKNLLKEKYNERVGNK